MSAAARLEELWTSVDGRAEGLQNVALHGHDPVLPSCFHVGELALATIGAVGAASAAIWQDRTGQAQSVTVGARAAAAMFRSEWCAYRWPEQRSGFGAWGCLTATVSRISQRTTSLI